MSPRTYGTLLSVAGVLAVIGGVLLLVLVQHPDLMMMWRTPLLIVVGVIAVVVGVLRRRGKITN